MPVMTGKEDKIRVGAYGSNGHQIDRLLANHPHARLCAVSALSRERSDGIPNSDCLKRYDTFEELLEDDEIDLISLCSPRRRDQASHAIRAMRAGKHVYAEKPCAMTEDELDQIIATSEDTGLVFHEMAGTAFAQPYLSVRNLVSAGAIGEVVQVLVQKSYPLAPQRRPQDEDVDGGLVMQVGVHAVRMIEHVAGVKVSAVQAVQTQLGNPGTGDLRIAAVMQCTLENKGVAAITCNYLNPTTFGQWGNEMLRIFGTCGFVEVTDGGRGTRLVTNEKDLGPVEITGATITYHDMMFREILEIEPMPHDLQTELHPTRMVIRAATTAISA